MGGSPVSVTEEVYCWCGRCGKPIEPEIRDDLHPFCQACRDDPHRSRIPGAALGAALRSLRYEEFRGVPE
ncbi:hypothetical protein DSECCO2_213120 [anaerobic digester metagenome]